MMTIPIIIITKQSDTTILLTTIIRAVRIMVKLIAVIITRTTTLAINST